MTYRNFLFLNFLITLMAHSDHGGSAVGQSVCLACERLMFESQPRQFQVEKKGSDSSIDKHSATDVSVTGPWR